MQDLVSTYFEKFKRERHVRRRLTCILLALALLVGLGVYWQLRLTGAALTNETYCGLEEHTHTEECYETVLVCGLEECEATEGHTHTEACYETQTVLVCGLEESEAHTHSDACYTNVLTCGQEESEGHTHTEDCYDEDGNLICALEESKGHTHDESCYTLELTCGLEESEGHVHTDECYETQEVLVCGQEECEATEGHTHTDECYEEQLVCGLEEHTHTIECMSDESADVETAADWKATLPELTGVWADDVVAIAQSQLGYTESTANFILGDDGEIRKGYTRYGAWYGNAYGDWCAMFASFCLYYADVPEDVFPEAAGVYAWTVSLDDMGLYADAEDYTPAAGDIVFIDNSGDDGQADHVGVVTEVDEDSGTITVIEGNCSDMVMENEYDLSDSSLVGYGVLPEQEDTELAESEEDEEVQEDAQEELQTLYYDGGDYTVTVSYGAEAALPENVELICSEYDADSTEYQERYAAAAELYGWEEDEDNAVRLFNIGLYADGEEIEPAATVEVTITLLEQEDTDEYTVLHFAEEVTETVDAASDYLDGEQTVTFQVDGFSDFMLLAEDGDDDSDDSSTTTEQGDIGEELDGDYAYLSDVAMVEDSTTTSGYAMRTGTSPWDDDDEAGNDSTDLNNSLRTYDIATYTVTFTSRVRDDAPYKFYYQGNLYFEFIIQGDSSEVQFETGSMGWLDAKNATYTVTEETIGEETYQVLRGYYSWQPASGNDHAIGESTQELTLAIRALALCNGDTIQPTFTFFLEGNEVGVDYENWGTEDYTGGVVTGSDTTCSIHSETEYQTITAPEISISAVASYNIAITADTTYTAVGSYDFSTGNSSALNTNAGTVYGRLGSYGVTIQIIGKTGQGLRGIELPKSGSNITFDLSLTSQYVYTDENGKSVTVNTSDTYAPLIWSLEENKSGGTQNDGRTVSTSGTTYARSAPYSSSGAYNSCYSGGSWTAEENDDGTVTVTISGCEISTVISNIPYTSASGTKTTTTYYDPDTIENYWDLQTFCISSGEVWVVQPFYEDYDAESEDDQGYIVDQYGDGTFTSYLTDTSLMMETEGGTTLGEVDDNSNQAVTNDDNKSMSMALTKSGSIVQTIQYLKVGYTSNSDPLTEGCESNGKDWVLQGNYLVIENGVSHDAAEGGNTGVAYDQLVKFDDAFFQPTSCDISYALWGAKPDGTGWDHTDEDGNELSPDDDGYDTEMINATTDDLVFFSSLEELEEAGYTCVAVLVERRGLQTTQMNHLHVHITGYAKQTAEADQVYMITHYCRAWNRSDLAEASGKTLDEILAMSSSEIAELLDEYLPSRTDYTLEQQIAAATSEDSADRLYNNYPECFWINGGSDGTSGHSATIHNYTKAQYVNGNYVGTNEGTYWGDSCLLVGYATGVTLNVAQTTTGGAEKAAYDMDTSQRIVDYELQASITRNAGESTTEGQTLTTNVTLTVTLPEGLTYLEGTSYIGGTYTTNGEGVQGTVTGGTLLEENGTVTVYDEDGNALYTVTLSLESNDDGTTTLTYTLTGVTLTDDLTQYLDTIHFSCQIGTEGNEDTDVQNGDSLTASATIESTEDCNRDFTATNGNYSECGILISKNSAAALAKFADQSVVEVNESMGFTLSVANNSTNETTVRAVEALPYSTDKVSSFDGDVVVTEFRVYSSTSTDEEGNTTYVYDAETDYISITFYYTTVESYRGKTSEDLQDEDFTDADNWTELKISDDGTAELPEGDFKPVAIVAVGTLPASTTLRMHIFITLPEGEGGDYVVNKLSNYNTTSLTSSARCRIVSRSLSGLAWVDLDGDGIQDSGDEAVINGVQVALLKLNETSGEYEAVCYSGTETPIVISTGQQVDVTRATGSNDTTYITTYTSGNYLFTNLPAGTYAVQFTTPTGTTTTIGTTNTTFAMADYVASPVNQGEDDDIDSDATGTYSESDYTLSSTIITGIVMPDVSTLTYGSYSSPHHDSGFMQYKLEITKVAEVETEDDSDSTPTLLEGVTFTLQKLNSDAKTVDKDFTELTGTTGEDGTVTFGTPSEYKGLTAGIYLLTETESADGYNLLDNPIKITIGIDGTIKAVDNTDSSVEYKAQRSNQLLKVTVTNTAGYELPASGGAGTWMYSLTGLVLCCGAGWVLMCRKRRAARS